MNDGPPSKKPPKSQETSKGDSAEDAKLWAKVRETVRPLSARFRAHSLDRELLSSGSRPLEKPTPGEAEDLAILFSSLMTPDDGTAPGAPKASKEPPPTALPPTASPQRPKSPPGPSGLDRRDVRRLAKGHLVIEARLDLHGLRQDEAFDDLSSFILRCRARGLVHVLIITGKGRSAPAPDPSLYLSEDHRGVLRRVVPEWLRGPALASYILGFETAHQRHGGEGALYVRLRRQ